MPAHVLDHLRNKSRTSPRMFLSPSVVQWPPLLRRTANPIRRTAAAMKYLVALFALFLCSPALHAKPRGIPPKRTGTMAEAMSGRSLTPDQVSLLEFAVAANPDDLSIH